MIDIQKLITVLDAHEHRGFVCWKLKQALDNNTRGRWKIKERSQTRQGFPRQGQDLLHLTDDQLVGFLLRDLGCPLLNQRKQDRAQRFILNLQALQASVELRVYLALNERRDPHPKNQYRMLATGRIIGSHIDYVVLDDLH